MLVVRLARNGDVLRTGTAQQGKSHRYGSLAYPPSPASLMISIEVPGLGVSFFAIPDAVRLDNPKLIL
jgi:hypothetical protein